MSDSTPPSPEFQEDAAKDPPMEEAQTPSPSDSASGPLSDPRLQVELIADLAVNLAQQQAGVSVVKRLALTSHHLGLLSDLRVRVEIEGGVADAFETIVDRVPAEATVAIPDVEVQLRPQALRMRTERERTRIIVTIEGIALDPPPSDAATGHPGGKVLVRKIDPITILAWNEWGGAACLPELLASFVQPNDPFVAKLLHGAREPLKARVGDDAFDGYQSKDPQRTFNIVGAIFEAASELGIGYLSSPASFEQHGQKVRLPESLERDRQGNCLDLTLFLAAACEQAGLHPLLVLIEGHIVLGVWVEEDSFPDATTQTASRVLNRVANREIILVESTSVTHGRKANFEDSMRAAQQALEAKRESMIAIDLCLARKLSFLPLSGILDERASGAVSVASSADGPGTVGRSTFAIPEVTSAEEAQAQETPKTRVDRWKNKLLDLSLRNRLLNFRPVKKTLQFLVPDLGQLEDDLQNEQKFRIGPVPDVLKGVRDLAALRRREGADVDTRPLIDAMGRGTLCAPETSEEIERRLTAIYREARTVQEESGSNNLFLTLGQLRWFETDSSPTERLAPLILLPVQLDKAARGGFKLSLSGEEPRPNITLLQKLRNDFGLETAGLEEFPTDDAGIDVPRVLATFRDRIKDRDRWEIIDTAYLGLLQFSKFVLWRDLEEHMEALADSPVVQLLVEGQSEALHESGDLPCAQQVDNTIAPGDLLCPLDADSSQIAAIQAATEGRTFVLQGPPGTGKSQTITNLIAHCLATGKRVLFVAEKSAALEVVQSRLEKIGLADACLAIHSNKAGKREIIDQIKKTLDAEQPTHPSSWDRTVRELEIRRDELNGYVSDLHRAFPCGFSFYTATSRLAALGSKPTLAIKLSNPIQTSPSDLDALRSAARDVAVSVREVSPLASHSLFGCGCDQWTPTAARRLGELARHAAQAARDLNTAREAVTGQEQLLPLPADGGMPSPGAPTLHAEVALAQALIDCPGSSRALLQAEDLTALRARLNTLIDETRKAASSSAKLGKHWSEDFLLLDPQEWTDRIAGAEKSFILMRWLRVRALAKELGEFRQPGQPSLDLGSAKRAFKQLSALQFAKQRLAEGQDLLLTHLSPACDDRGAIDPDIAEAVLTWTTTAREQIEALRDQHPHAAPVTESFIQFATQRDGARLRSEEARQALKSFISAHANFETAREALASEFSFDQSLAFGEASAAGWTERVIEAAERVDRDQDQLRPWASWVQAANLARSRSLGPLVDEIERGEIDPSTVEETVERSLLVQIAEGALTTSPRLQRFSRDSHEQRVAEFRELDRELLAISRRMAQLRCYENTPRLRNSSATGEAGILLREMNKQRRHIPIRRLFAEAPTLLQRIKPCLLMSPLSVAQFLSPTWQADLVIFDEASQIPVPESVGALGRGKAAVVVGDSKQLPPTAFFSKGTEDDEDDDMEAPEDLQSILEECEGSGVPTLNLGWHYRSQHESLIAFSNHHYYDNRLHTFPSAAEAVAGLGVSHHFLPGAVYDRGKSATNRGEAEAIVKDLLERCRAGGEGAAPPSIGVVAFSKVQATLIEDLVDEAVRSDAALDAARRSEREPLFIKNLENVQGDERDTILFSICYGPDASGKVAMAFGPINRQGGERRLNVAITRARRELVVFSRLRAEDIDLRRTQALGAQHLKVFLDYASRGPRAISEATSLTPGADFDSPFEKSVYDALTARGHQLDIQVGCSGYRIDMAVRHPDEPGRYVLGIECDGAAYHSAATARDRDRLRQSVLESLGWTLHRIWSTDYWASAEREIERTEVAIQAALSAPQGIPQHEPLAEPTPAEGAGANAAEAPAIAESESDLSAVSEAPPVYAASETGAPITPRSAESAPTSPGPESAFSMTPYPAYQGRADREQLEANDGKAIRKVMRSIIDAEAPITVDYLHRRSIAVFGVGRLGARISSSLQAQHEELTRSGCHLKGQTFWRSDQDPESWRGIRSPSLEVVARKIQEIPEAELANALDHELQQAFGSSSDDLMRAAARHFGIQSLGKNVRTLMGAAIHKIVTEGRAVKDGDQLRLPS